MKTPTVKFLLQGSRLKSWICAAAVGRGPDLLGLVLRENLGNASTLTLPIVSIVVPFWGYLIGSQNKNLNDNGDQKVGLEVFDNSTLEVFSVQRPSYRSPVGDFEHARVLILFSCVPKPSQ